MIFVYRTPSLSIRYVHNTHSRTGGTKSRTKRRNGNLNERSAEERAVARQKYHEHMNWEFTSTTYRPKIIGVRSFLLIVVVCLLFRSCT